MKRKILVALLFSMTVVQPCLADDFDDFMGSVVKDFDTFIDDANREFVNFLRNPWPHFDAEKPVKKRVSPEPLIPVTFNPTTEPPSKPTSLTIEEIIDLTTRQSTNKPVVNVTPEVEPVVSEKPVVSPVKPSTPSIPVKPTPDNSVEDNSGKPSTDKPHPQRVSEPTKVEDKNVQPIKPDSPAKPTKTSNPLYAGGSGREAFEYAGIKYYIDNKLKNAIRLNSVSENDIADAYETLLRSNHGQIVADLNQLRQNDLGNDWALYSLIKQISEKFVGKNESVVMRQFLLNKMGFKSRMARKSTGNELTLLYAPDCQLYACVFVEIDGLKYYDVDNRTGAGFFISKYDAPGATKKVNMDIAASPRAADNYVTSTRQDKPTAAVTVNVSKPLIDFYNSLPQCDYKVYANAAVDPKFESELLPQLKNAIKGKSETEAADILLKFVQRAFDYKTDPEQFGYEKPFFVEELFYYPACDCEDRSVLYRYLVKKLLGLDVVLLDYPNHLATAVKFNSPVQGDNVNVGGDIYTVCDPTFIGASIGMAMPQYKMTAAKVVKM